MAALSQKIYYADNVQNGVVFWNQYEDALNRAGRCMVYRRKLSSGLSALKLVGARDGENSHPRCVGNAVI